MTDTHADLDAGGVTAHAASPQWGEIVGERITIGVGHNLRSAAKLTELSRAERNRLARGRPLRRLPPERVQEAIDRAAGLPRGISAGTAYTITTVDESRFTLS